MFMYLGELRYIGLFCGLLELICWDLWILICLGLCWLVALG